MTTPLPLPDDGPQFTPLDPCDWRLIHEALCMYVTTLESLVSDDEVTHARWVRDKALERFA